MLAMVENTSRTAPCTNVEMMCITVKIGSLNLKFRPLSPYPPSFWHTNCPFSVKPPFRKADIKEGIETFFILMSAKESSSTPLHAAAKSASGSSRAQSIYELIETPRAAQVLPSLGSVLTELEDLLIVKRQAPLQEVSRLIRSDQSMALRVLRLANSAYYAPAEPVINVEDALIYLGLNQVRSSILTARCIEKTCNLPDDIIRWKDFWTHAVAVGCITQTFSRHLKEPKLAEQSYYVMGLLHDIGKLVLAQVSADDFTVVMETAKERQTTISAVEIEILGLDHSSLGAWYLQQQGMPPSLVEPIRLHHAWQVSPSNAKHAALISLADEIANQYHFGFSGSYLPADHAFEKSESWQHVTESCGIHKNDTPKFLQLMKSEIERLPSLIHNLVA